MYYVEFSQKDDRLDRAKPGPFRLTLRSIFVFPCLFGHSGDCARVAKNS